jgi:hypothetical protein
VLGRVGRDGYPREPGTFQEFLLLGGDERGVDPTAVHQSSRSYLVGRDGEIDLIEGLVGGLQRAGSVLILTGEAGVGKTVLLDLAADCGAAQEIQEGWMFSKCSHGLP